jgi:hypothetical protein
MPDDWSGHLTVARCRKCVIPSPRRLIDVLRKQNATGFALFADIPLEPLKPYALKAKVLGHAVSVNLPPHSKAQ